MALCAEPKEEYCPQDQPSRLIWKSQLDSTRDWSQLLRLGSGLLHLQLRHQKEGKCLVGKVHNDSECSAGLGIGVWAGGGILWVRVPRIDGRLQVVGNRDLQAGL